MAHFCSWALTLHVAACLFTITHGTFYPSLISLSDRCNQTYRVWRDVRIRLASKVFLPSNTTCTLTFLPDVDTRLIARFRSYYMSPKYTNEYDDCQNESIQLYDSHGDPKLSDSVGRGYCKMGKPSSLFDLGASGQFQYTTFQGTDILAADLEILVTAVRDKQGSKCTSDYFDCYLNNYCVSNAVTCNGFDDCGNNRDETHGCKLSGWAIAAIVLAAFVFFCCVAVTVLYVKRRRLRHRYQSL
ncbi:hypothetical protein BsWGS_11558 [Bradybaena similaris]